mgnify:CR=1 FL=1
MRGNGHDAIPKILARMASAPFQAQALHCIEASLTELELAVVRRGRNAKSRVPRNASIAEYRSSTALEALLGYLYLSRQQSRLEQILQQVAGSMCRSLLSEAEGGAKA